MKHAVRLGLCVVAFLASGCRTACTADDEASPEQLAKERRAAGRAQTICKELQRPRIALVDDRLMLSATREVHVAARSELPQDGARFEPLFVRLERYKRHYKAIWPADAFEPFATVELDPALEAPRAMSVLEAVAAAGYGSMRIRTGDVARDVTWATCGPAIGAHAKDESTARELVAAAAAACSR